MLTKPDDTAEWTIFSLDGTSEYGLSYLDDIALEWLDQAIHGLETMLPFCVKGFLVPNRMLCTVSYWNCHIVVEDDKRYPLKKEEISHEYSHTSMLEFCKYLYDDIINCVDEWASFIYRDDDPKKKKKQILKKLKKLKELIFEREEDFGENRGFC